MSRQGTRIGPYALQVQVGRCAGCTVWHAVRADGKARGPDEVAVRLLDDPGDTRAQTRLESEYQRLKAMDGQGAPLALAHYAGFGALAMERKTGSSLRALLDASMSATLNLDPATALEVALGVARTLRHAHSLPQGVVHGRLAPADILLGRDSSITLMGWGGWSPQPWSPGIAPEVMRGRPPSAYADMYAVGAVLCTMLEPRLTQAQGLQAAVHKIERGWPAAGRLIQDLLSPEPTSRFPDMGPIIHELLSLQRHHGGVARVGELAERCGSFRPGPKPSSRPGPAAPVAPAPLPPITPPPVVPTTAAAPTKPAAPPEPQRTQPEDSGSPPRQSPQGGSIPAPVAPRPDRPAAEPAPDPQPEPEPEQVDPGDLPSTPMMGPEPTGETEPEPGETTDPEPTILDVGEPPDDDDEGASMQLVERVALALVGLLGLALLAWLGQTCLGG